MEQDYNPYDLLDDLQKRHDLQRAKETMSKQYPAIPEECISETLKPIEYEIQTQPVKMIYSTSDKLFGEGVGIYKMDYLYRHVFPSDTKDQLLKVVNFIFEADFTGSTTEGFKLIDRYKNGVREGYKIRSIILLVGTDLVTIEFEWKSSAYIFPRGGGIPQVSGTSGNLIYNDGLKKMWEQTGYSFLRGVEERQNQNNYFMPAMDPEDAKKLYSFKPGMGGSPFGLI